MYMAEYGMEIAANFMLFDMEWASYRKNSYFISCTRKFAYDRDFLPFLHTYVPAKPGLAIGST